MTEAELTAARAEMIWRLRSHDWYFDRADDPSAYRTGLAVRARLESLRQALPDGVQLWNAYAPVGFKVATPGGES